MKNNEIKKLRDRDGWCWHCGKESDLVPHHRANRGMGSFKALDTLQNVIMVCAEYNAQMESDAAVAAFARNLGHKLSKFMSPSAPLFDNYLKKWYLLDEKGSKAETEPPNFLI